MTIFSVGVPSRPRWRSCSSRHSCRSRAATPIGSKPWTSCSARSTSSTGHGPIAASSSNDATRYPSSSRLPMMADADLAHQRLVGLHRQLPHQVVGERARRRERVLDRRQLLDFLRRARPVAVVEIVAEEVLVVLVVPGVGLVRPAAPASVFSGAGGGLGRLQLLGRHLLEHRVLDHLLVEQIGQLERRHRQQLDRLLQRRRQNQLLDELGVKFLLDAHDGRSQSSRVPSRRGLAAAAMQFPGLF